MYVLATTTTTTATTTITTTTTTITRYYIMLFKCCYIFVGLVLRGGDSDNPVMESAADTYIRMHTLLSVAVKSKFVYFSLVFFFFLTRGGGGFFSPPPPPPPPPVWQKTILFPNMFF